MPIHTDFRKGQPIRVMWKAGGPHLIGKFEESGSGKVRIALRDGSVTWVQLSDVRAISIDRNSRQ